jgi:hypothetical protein
MIDQAVNLGNHNLQLPKRCQNRRFDSLSLTDKLDAN